MDQPLYHGFDDTLAHFRFQHVTASRPFIWLSRGLSDMRDNLPASLSWGICFALLGYFILAYAANRPYLFTAAVSGFFLVGPLAAAGLYEISRRHEKGEPCTLQDSIRGLAGHGDSLLYFGLFFAIVMISWERISAILFALFYTGQSLSMSNVYREIFTSGNYVDFVLAYMLIGGAIAAVIYALSAIALPLMMDQDTDIITAMVASTRAVRGNLIPMTLWAAMIVILIAIGFATWMVGLALTLPLAGHATWHAYRDLIQHD
ncbi:MAG: DUF2189 domain-containing protein [Betaproteobacteria bacterium]|nr:DUF2189 domain-containing protein [Betaproteobacteria bacterium]